MFDITHIPSFSPPTDTYDEKNNNVNTYKGQKQDKNQAIVE